MATSDSENDSEGVKISDHFNISVSKRKDVTARISNKRAKYDEDDEELVFPDLFVKIEIEEIDESHLNEMQNQTIAEQNASTSEICPTRKSTRPQKTKKYPCSKCDYAFDSYLDLQAHSSTHKTEPRHKCEHCGRCFNKAGSLKLHIKVHDIKDEKCPLCDLTFTLKSSLNRHMATHERRERCDSCQTAFYTKQQLDEHASRCQHIGQAVMPRSCSKNKKQKRGSQETELNRKENKTIKNNTKEKEITLKREELTHATQCAIVNKMHKGRPVSDICRLYNITPEVLNEIWADREKYALPKKGVKKTTKHLNDMLDARIVEWFNLQKSKNIPITGQMIQDIGEDIAKEIGFVAFNGSKKWLDRFKQKYNIVLRATASKRDYHSNSIESKWKRHFFTEQWCDVREGFTDEEIYTGDEVGLYYNPSKGRIKKMGGKKFIHGYVKDRLSIFMCTNVTGTDKKKLFVCGTEDPLIHSFRNPKTLPVDYVRHTQAHFTTDMFEGFVKNWNSELEKTEQKAILILDRATIHSKLQLTNLKLVFVPWKSSSSLIPIKNGIYTTFRDEFRRLLIEEKAMNIIRGVDRNLTCLEGLEMLEKAWERTPCEVITNSFVATGFDVGGENEFTEVDKPKVYDNDEEILCKMFGDFDMETYFMDVSNLDNYLTVDEHLLTGQGTNVSVFGGNHKSDTTPSVEKNEELLPINTERPDDEDREWVVRRNRALEDLEIVKKYLYTNMTSYANFCNFVEVENFVKRNPFPYHLPDD